MTVTIPPTALFFRKEYVMNEKQVEEILDELLINKELLAIRDIPLELIDDFPGHPFQVRLDEDMDQLVESIRQNGVITPVTLRTKEGGRYEIVSGHRRKKACELAGLATMKAEVKELSRDEAIILMVESNLQRSKILPSEKAFSYKMRLDAMNRQGKRFDITSVPLGQKLGQTSRAQLAEVSPDSNTQIQRYIRLTHLLPELLTIVDIGANDDALQCCKIYENGNILTLAMDEDAALLPLLKKNVGPDGEDGGDDNTQTLTQFSMNRILMTLGLAEASTEEQAVTAIQQLQQENDTLRLARITDAVQVAINEHRIPADKKDHFVNLGKKVGLDDLRETMNLYNPVKKPTEVINPNGGSAPLNLKWEEYTAEQLVEMRENDREKYCKLYKEHYGVNPTF